MTVAVFDHEGPWTEEEYLALGETSQRVELFDGSLHVTPAPTPRHQNISGELRVLFRGPARDAGLHVLEGVNVRLKPGRIPIPDLVITGPIDFDALNVEACDVRLVCEIISPSNAATDKVLKMHYYAAAGIEWYLLVEQATAALHLYRKRGAHYVVQSVTEPGAVLVLTEPVKATIRPEDLLP
ncbi:Endonuclease, Uma2 family (restriction endonuclease fold) [Micromonospora phaseoli]|uniref:Endonuclease, Uma2 family (Restriction endonuclease fold) n=1 Tax=Micromonospora phaseoli TaxID=1144548 RepID=A0A1H6X477_9ACTN|nr:Uma2 family endonuclease [Micromonospora phaseoli]PZW01931.1 Uma2 family endonuclease [Micromonospora phaseoli]GIJ80623.1 restriction endonuclease [Micromonospora phaseoli]SEJ19840.1 Endonuclease, Uma2 family (restriction endonuclease fold) [Micromonospora phaseoli]